MDKKTVRLFFIAGVLFLLAAIVGFASGANDTYLLFAAIGLAQFAVAYYGSKKPPKKRVTLEESKMITLDEQLKMLINEGQRVTAIKIYREMIHCELLEASNYVDELEKKMKNE